MKEPFIQINSRIPRKLWLDLHKAVFSKDNPDAQFDNFSEALRYYSDLGLKAKALMNDINNPESLKELEALRDQNKQIEIINTMTEDARKRLAFNLEFVENKKWEQRHLA